MRITRAASAAVALTLAALALAGCGTDPASLIAHSVPTTTTTPPPVTRNVAGTFTLSYPMWARTNTGPGNCQGTGKYSAFIPKAGVVMTDPSDGGHIIGRTLLGSGFTGPGGCLFDFKMAATYVTDDVSVYVVDVIGEAIGGGVLFTSDDAFNGQSLDTVLTPNAG